MGKGPSIAFGANIHPKVFDQLVKLAKNITLHPGSDPSWYRYDLWAMQVVRAGIQRLCCQFHPLYAYLGEAVSMTDIKYRGVLAYFIASIDSLRGGIAMLLKETHQSLWAFRFRTRSTHHFTGKLRTM